MSVMEALLDEAGVSFRQVDGNQQIRCPNPDHDDAHASCSVHLGKQLIRCNGCELRGSVIQLAMAIRGISFKEAAQSFENPTAHITKKVGKGKGFRVTYKRREE